MVYLKMKDTLSLPIKAVKYHTTHLKYNKQERIGISVYPQQEY